MNLFRKIITILPAAALCTLSMWPVVQPGTVRAETETGDRPVIKIPRAGGSAAFEKFGCITCHLADGRGGQNEGGYGADLRTTKLSQEELAAVIRDGRAGKGMPPYKGMIDDETLGLLAQYIKDDLRLK